MKQEQDVELAAFCDIVKERAEKGAKEYGAPGAKVYTDYRELLERVRAYIQGILNESEA